MDKTKRNFSTKTALCCALLLITLCVLLVGTITFARYQWEFAQASYQFVPESQRIITIYDGYLTKDRIDSGRLSPVSGAWERTGNGAVVTFGVANGTLAEFALEERTFAIRIAAGLAIEEADALTVSLSYTDENGSTVTVTGTPEKIVEGSMQQATFGDGWVYRFFEGEEELCFTLKGNEFSYQNFTVTVTGSVSTTLLDLQVTQLHG